MIIFQYLAPFCQTDQFIGAEQSGMWADRNLIDVQNMVYLNSRSSILAEIIDLASEGH